MGVSNGKPHMNFSGVVSNTFGVYDISECEWLLVQTTYKHGKSIPTRKSHFWRWLFAHLLISPLSHTVFLYTFSNLIYWAHSVLLIILNGLTPLGKLLFYNAVGCQEKCEDVSQIVRVSSVCKNVINLIISHNKFGWYLRPHVLHGVHMICPYLFTTF